MSEIKADRVVRNLGGVLEEMRRKGVVTPDTAYYNFSLQMVWASSQDPEGWRIWPACVELLSREELAGFRVWLHKELVPTDFMPDTALTSNMSDIGRIEEEKKKLRPIYIRLYEFVRDWEDKLASGT